MLGKHIFNVLETPIFSVFKTRRHPYQLTSLIDIRNVPRHIIHDNTGMDLCTTGCSFHCCHQLCQGCCSERKQIYSWMSLAFYCFGFPVVSLCTLCAVLEQISETFTSSSNWNIGRVPLAVSQLNFILNSTWLYRTDTWDLLSPITNWCHYVYSRKIIHETK